MLQNSISICAKPPNQDDIRSFIGLVVAIQRDNPEGVSVGGWLVSMTMKAIIILEMMMIKRRNIPIGF